MTRSLSFSDPPKMQDKLSLRINLKIPHRRELLFTHLSKFDRPTEEVFRLLAIGLKWDKIDSDPTLLFDCVRRQSVSTMESRDALVSSDGTLRGSVTTDLGTLISSEFLAGPPA